MTDRFNPIPLQPEAPTSDREWRRVPDAAPRPVTDARGVCVQPGEAGEFRRGLHPDWETCEDPAASKRAANAARKAKPVEPRDEPQAPPEWAAPTDRWDPR